jgi:hypothetical protein
LEQKLRAAQEDLTNARTLGSQDTQNKDAEIASLRDQLDQQTQQLQQVDTRLAAAVQTKRAGLREIQKTIAANVQLDIALLHLADKLEEEDYHAIRDAVVAADTAKIKKTYSDTATFLILESMGGTWRMYLKLVRGKFKKTEQQNRASWSMSTQQEFKTWEEHRDLILRQMLYDLTMWYSMANSPKKTRYMSHHVQAFITAFGLDNNEFTTGTVDSSDDDGPGPPADAAAPDLLITNPQTNQKPRNMLSRPASPRTKTSTPTGQRTSVRLNPRKPIQNAAGTSDEAVEEAFKTNEQMQAARAAENQRLEAERQKENRGQGPPRVPTLSLPSERPPETPRSEALEGPREGKELV